MNDIVFRIAVIDGQGGGMGYHLVEELRKSLAESVEILALGTNAVATSSMMRAGANRGASGENAIVQTVKSVDLIVGSLGIVLAHAMMGEVTPKMAAAVSGSPAIKVLLPINHCRVELAGVKQEPLPHLINRLVEKVKQIMEEKQGVRI